MLYAICRIVRTQKTSPNPTPLFPRAGHSSNACMYVGRHVCMQCVMMMRESSAPLGHVAAQKLFRPRESRYPPVFLSVTRLSHALPSGHPAFPCVPLGQLNHSSRHNGSLYDTSPVRLSVVCMRKVGMHIHITCLQQYIIIKLRHVSLRCPISSYPNRNPVGAGG